MVAHKKLHVVAPKEYLEAERSAGVRSEYYDGEIVSMTGASRQHDRASGNIFASLHASLKGTRCEPFTSDMRVRAPAGNRYYYPDISVACDGAEFEDAHVDTLINPTLIVEVLSESTEKADRGDKLINYQSIRSLESYLIVAQDSPLIQIYERQTDDSWRYSLHQGMEATIALSAIGAELRLTDVYARVEFPQTELPVNQPL